MSLKLHCLVMLSLGLFKYNSALNSEYEYLQAIIAETNPPPLPTLPPFFNETFTFPDGVPIPPDLLDRFYRFTRYPAPNVPPWEAKGRNNQGKFGLNNKHSFPANSIYFTFGFGVAMFFLGIFVVVSVYLCVMYCKKFLTERVNYLYRQQLLHNSNNNMSSSISNSNNLIFNQHPQINNHIIDIDLLPNNNCIISNNINNNSNNNSNHSNNSNSSHDNLLLSSSSQQDKPRVISQSQSQPHSHQKEELHEQLMINLECIEMIDINNPSYEPQVIKQPNLYVNTYTNKGNVTKGNNVEDEDEDNDSQDDEDETPEGEEVPNASHDLIIDE
jgi:hypothetical protein